MGHDPIWLYFCCHFKYENILVISIGLLFLTRKKDLKLKELIRCFSNSALEIPKVDLYKYLKLF